MFRRSGSRPADAVDLRELIVRAGMLFQDRQRATVASGHLGLDLLRRGAGLHEGVTHVRVGPRLPASASRKSPSAPGRSGNSNR